jgi:hypothetical protein
MYIFNRTRLARPDKAIEAMASSVEVAEKVTEITGLDIHVWQTRFGAPVGTISWSCRLESQAELHTATEKLTVDATYIDMAMSMAGYYEGAAEDTIMRVVSGTPAPAPSKFYVATTATMANGKYKDAIAWGVSMQEFTCDALDAPGLFGTAGYGGFADVGWLMGRDSMDEVDRAADWEMSNEEYHERIDAARDLFIPGSGVQRLVERLN